MVTISSRERSWRAAADKRRWGLVLMVRPCSTSSCCAAGKTYLADVDVFWGFLQREDEFVIGIGHFWHTGVCTRRVRVRRRIRCNQVHNSTVG